RDVDRDVVDGVGLLDGGQQCVVSQSKGQLGLDPEARRAERRFGRIQRPHRGQEAGAVVHTGAVDTHNAVEVAELTQVDVADVQVEPEPGQRSARWAAAEGGDIERGDDAQRWGIAAGVEGRGVAWFVPAVVDLQSVRI